MINHAEEVFFFCFTQVEIIDACVDYIESLQKKLFGHSAKGIFSGEEEEISECRESGRSKRYNDDTSSKRSSNGGHLGTARETQRMR